MHVCVTPAQFNRIAQLALMRDSGGLGRTMSSSTITEQIADELAAAFAQNGGVWSRSAAMQGGVTELRVVTSLYPAGKEKQCLTKTTAPRS